MKAMDYHTYMSDRVNKKSSDKTTLRVKLAEYYHGMVDSTKQKDDFVKKVKERFPHISYGQNVKSDTFKKSFPASFKRYFFKLVKNIIVSKKTRKGDKPVFPKQPPSLKMAVGGRINGCKDPLYVKSQNVELTEFKIGQRIANLRKKKIPNAWRSRAFKRHDMKKDYLKHVFMKQDEIENCTFEPNTFRLAFHLNKTQANRMFITTHDPEFIDCRAGNDPQDKRARNGMLPAPGKFHTEMGENFEKSDPAIFKAGKLKKAKILLKQGKTDDCISTLIQGFDLLKVF